MNWTDYIMFVVVSDPNLWKNPHTFVLIHCAIRPFFTWFVGQYHRMPQIQTAVPVWDDGGLELGVGDGEVLEDWLEGLIAVTPGGANYQILTPEELD